MKANLVALTVTAITMIVVITTAYHYLVLPLYHNLVLGQ